MGEILKVNELEIRAVVSEEDPYGQDGFSALFANIFTSDEKQITFLNRAQNARISITIQCGRLEVRGEVTKCFRNTENLKAVLTVLDIKFLKAT